MNRPGRPAANPWDRRLQTIVETVVSISVANIYPLVTHVENSKFPLSQSTDSKMESDKYFCPKSRLGTRSSSSRRRNNQSSSDK